MNAIEFLRTTRGTVVGTAVFVTAVLSLGVLIDASAPPRETLHQHVEIRASRIAAEEAREALEASTLGMCREAISYHTQNRAKMDANPTSWTDDGDFIVRQPYIIADRALRAECTLRANGGFEVALDS